MKIVTSVTTVALDKHGKPVHTPPGVVDVDEDTAADLIAKGFAKSLADAKAEAAAASADGDVQVRTDGKGPRVLTKPT